MHKLTQILLSPLSILYGWIGQVRRFGYKFGFLYSCKFDVPIISIGNLEMGGTGKTPLTIWLNSQIEQRGLKALILTRGYKSDYENKSILLDASVSLKSSQAYIGDEPRLILNSMSKGTLGIGKKRAKNLLTYFSEGEADVVLLDDGFQHLKIERDLNILILNAQTSLDRYKVFPLGSLREDVSAMKDADIIAVSRSRGLADSGLSDLRSFIRTINKGAPLCFFDYEIKEVKRLGNSKRQVPEVFEKDRKFLAFSALGKNESFVESLKSFGFNVVHSLGFSDHHRFTIGDVEDLHKTAKEWEASLICSEKDAMKLIELENTEEIYYTSIDLKFVSGEEELMSRLIKLLKH